ncbi:hypothetical protein A2834_01320 [Candidatus Giovannonibacteria bacterium RIFCSPHIGHO2_01_FULL_45_23]|uniref:Thiolase N-terminal domain-containing protein n=1 Tax=Candidatus Giovannonibacteria bacterium RIFCSPHIGHO2_01_FULL_45_23 TaxID=1798325 RepID=A0A1F5VJF0_9BACT|nr:MAG: hypothetical protein A2834_01320 [Candidatus Giovannonibacteria bacterium RIFCSPHIGHO2_01_FULL_45_23]
MKEVLVVDATRSPIGTGISKYPLLKSALITLSPQDLALQVLDASFKKTKIPPAAVDILRVGSNVSLKSEYFKQAPDREIALRAGMYNASCNISQKACSSGLLAIAEAAQAIRYEKANIAIGMGLDMMCNVPDSVNIGALTCPITKKSMAELADQKTRELGFTKEDCDVYADESYARAKKHLYEYESGEYLTPIVLEPETGTGYSRIFNFDQNVLTDEKIFKNAKDKILKGCELTTVYNSSKYGDACATLTLMSPGKAKKYKFEPLARLLAYAENSLKDPKDFPIAPVGAVLKALKIAKRSLNNIDSFWVNEAFPVSPLFFMKELGIPWDIVNPCGGAIAFGHAL